MIRSRFRRRCTLGIRRAGRGRRRGVHAQCVAASEDDSVQGHAADDDGDVQHRVVGEPHAAQLAGVPGEAAQGVDGGDHLEPVRDCGAVGVELSTCEQEFRADGLGGRAGVTEQGMGETRDRYSKGNGDTVYLMISTEIDCFYRNFGPDCRSWAAALMKDDQGHATSSSHEHTRFASSMRKGARVFTLSPRTQDQSSI